MPQKKFSLKARIQSFRYAFNGLKILFTEEHNARIHLLAAIIAISLGFYVQLSIGEWIVLSTVICLVFILEIINSALENLCDLIRTEEHPLIKKIKDLAASAVLIASILALVVGALIFVPKLI